MVLNIIIFTIFLFSINVLYIYLFINNSIIEYTLITGASSSHELSIYQFIYYYLLYNKNISLVIWDLGFTNMFVTSLKKILKHNRHILYKKFNYSLYPSYFKINKNKGEYAWKPIIINITYYLVKNTILWLDAGCIAEQTLSKVFYDINKYQCWSIYSCGNISTWTHIGMIKYFNISTNILKKKTCAGGLVGFKWNSRISKIVLNEWVECALHKECIAPVGSNRINHRQDQSALSILLYKYEIFNICPYNIYNIKTNKDLHNKTIALILFNRIISYLYNNF